MKKSYLLSLIIALCFTIQCWAEFSPTDGKMYALKEKTSGLYLDIQTLGIHEPGHTTNSISLNANPCVIYFEAGDGTWKLKNINGTYAGNFSSGRHWNTTISNESYDWIIAEETGGLTIAKGANNFIGWDNNKTITAGSALYNNAEGGNGNAKRIYFSLVEYTSANLSQGYYSLKSATGTYFNFTPHNSLGTAATFQDTPSYLKIIPSVNILIFEDKDKQGKYISTEGSAWNVTTSVPTLWEFNNVDETGFGLIQRYGVTSETKSLGSDDSNINAGTGIFTNVSNTGCYKWYITGIFDYPTLGTTNNEKIEFTSGKIYYYNPCNTIRLTLTESDAFFENGAKRMSLDEFYLYDANGTEVKLDASNVVGNNCMTFKGMFDRTDGTYAGTKTGNDGTEDDWFEILLPENVDLGGAFSFSFVTEDTRMNAKAFKIETFYTPRYAPRFNGIYTINYKNGYANAAVFIDYNEDQNVGYKLIATGTHSTQAAGDKYFTITPSGVGYRISTQGKYLKAPELTASNHLMFSDSPSDAGVYIFEETDVESGIFKMRDPSAGNNKKYVNDHDNLVFGNDGADTENLSTFTITPVSSYPFTVTEAGMATLCLPFNVKIPAGMYAYDFEATDISDSNETDVYNCVMKVLVRPGEVLKAGTPVIVKALEGDYEMEIVMLDHEAKTNLANSLLRGNFVSQTLTQSQTETVKKFIFTKPLNSPVGFYRMQDEGGEIGANKCWMEWDVRTMPANAKAFQITFEQTTDIEGVSTANPSAPVIYDLAGRRLKAPQRGFNIVNGKKVIIQ